MQRITMIVLLGVLLLTGCQQNEKEPSISINVSFNDKASETPKDGRLLLMLSNNDDKEPRFQINDGNPST